MKPYEFEIVGTLAASDAVVGVLSMPHGRRAARAVLLLPPEENLSDHKQRERILRAREEMVQGGLVKFPETETRALSAVFSGHAHGDIKAPLTHPDYVRQVIDLLFGETQAPLVVLDAKSRECFWTALRTMGADPQDLLAVAELRALRPEAQTRRVSKPIGEAHILCADIQSQQRRIDVYSDDKARDLVHMIRRSTKVKLPDIDLDEQILASHYLRDLEMNTGERKELFFLNRIVRLRMALRFMGREKPEIAVLKQEDWAGLAKMRDAMRGLERDVRDESYERRFSDVPRFLVLRGDPQDVLTRRYKKHYQFDADRFDFDSLLQFHDGYGAEELRFRGGIHANPFPLSLFETRMTTGIEKNHALTVATLVAGGQDELTAYNFIKPAGLEGGPYYLHPHKMVVALERGRADSVAIVDMQTKRTLYAGGRLSFNNAGDMAFMHALSGIARMHEPDYAPVTFEARRRGLTDLSKGRFPYFDYINIEGFGPAASSVRIGPKGHAEDVDSKRRHLVRGHPRRLRDEAGNVREIVIIPPHLRGDESKGFVAKGYRLDK